MPRRSLKWLEDIRRSGRVIREATAGITLEDYLRNDLLRAAVERHFEIIGEAMGRVLRAEPDVAASIPDAARIIAFRNLLIHGYDVVEHATVLKVAQESVPPLLTRVDELIRELSSSA